MAYFINENIDEIKCNEEATRRFHSSGKKSWIHHHKFTESCNDECYLAPKNSKAIKAPEDETRHAFN